MNNNTCTFIRSALLCMGVLFALPVSAQPGLPPVPVDETQLSTVAEVYVKEFIFEGNTVYSNEQLADTIRDFTSRTITAEELQEAKDKITLKYVDAGYINSGAILPDQQVKSGQILLQIIEGTLSEPDIQGNKGVNKDYIASRLRNDETEILNISDMQQRLQLLQQNPLFRRINAELGPGVRLGEGILSLQVEEASPYTFNISLNNHRSPSIGAYRLEVDARHGNLTGWGDAFYARYGLTEGLDEYTLSYTRPLNRYDTTLTLRAERSSSKVVSEPFSSLDVESDAETYSIGLSHPLYRTPNQTFSLGLTVEKRQSETRLLGRRFPFSPGVQDGISRITVLRFTQEWLDRSRVQVIAARSSFNFGINALNATINEDGTPDSEFFTWLGQFQWVRRLAFLESQILLRTDIQWAQEDLLPLEKFSIGGATTVRGYRENQITRDSGLIASIEWRIPITQLRMPGISTNPTDGSLQIAPFIDYGRGWNADSSTPSPRDIYSIGLGLRWAASQHLYAEIYWGHALRDLPAAEEYDIQDDGLHFELRASF